MIWTSDPFGGEHGCLTLLDYVDLIVIFALVNMAKDECCPTVVLSKEEVCRIQRSIVFLRAFAMPRLPSRLNYNLLLPGFVCRVGGTE